MKQRGWTLAVLMLASPAWAAKKLTVQQFKDLLLSLDQSKKTDEEVATDLKQIQLTEGLPRSAMNQLVGLIPRKYSIEQIYVLEARGAILAPTAVDPNMVQANQFTHYINSTESRVESEKGTKKFSTTTDKTPWGQNGYLALLGQGPVLSNILQETQASGTIQWLRWETIYEKNAAVDSFSVDRILPHGMDSFRGVYTLRLNPP